MNNVDFLKSIVEGINPYTSEVYLSDDLLRRPDVVTRLELLINEIENFDKWQTDLIQVMIPETTVTYLAKNIAEVVSMRQKDVLDKVRAYLVKNGYLKKSLRNKRYIATELGESIGITNRVDLASEERYFNVYYSENAQHFVISKLSEILN